MPAIKLMTNEIILKIRGVVSLAWPNIMKFFWNEEYVSCASWRDNCLGS
jgi:hypothetical protein